jgi:hypothetical protein
MGAGGWFYFSNTGEGVAEVNTPSDQGDQGEVSFVSINLTPATEPAVQQTEPTTTATAQPIETAPPTKVVPAETGIKDNSHLSVEYLKGLKAHDSKIVGQIADYKGYAYIYLFGVAKEIVGRVITISADNETLFVYVDDSVPIVKDWPISWDEALKRALKIEAVEIGDAIQIAFKMPIGESNVQVWYMKLYLEKE